MLPQWMRRDFPSLKSLALLGVWVLGPNLGIGTTAKSNFGLGVATNLCRNKLTPQREITLRRAFSVNDSFDY